MKKIVLIIDGELLKILYFTKYIKLKLHLLTFVITNYPFSFLKNYGLSVVLPKIK